MSGNGAAELVGEAHAILEIGAVDIVDVDVFNDIPAGEQSYGAVAVFGPDAADLNVGDGAVGALVGVEGDGVVVAGALEVADNAEAAVAVEVDTVHVHGHGIAMVKVKVNVFHREILNAVKGGRKVNGIFQGEIRELKALDGIKNHAKADITLGLINLGPQGVGILS